MSSEQYCPAEVTNVEYVFENNGLSFTPRFVIPLSCCYHPDMDVNGDIKEDGIQWYQERIETLRRAV